MLSKIKRMWAEADAEARKPIVIGETVYVTFRNPPMESVTDYLKRTRVDSPRDRFFALLNMGSECSE